MKISLFSLICLLTLTVGCQEKSRTLRKEKTTIYSVQGDATSYQKDTIRFIEEEIYSAENQLIERVFYHPDGSLKATESFESKEGKSGSKYKDDADQLLSYYTFDYNASNQKEISKAYDASNDELLRIEAYSYDVKGNRNKKEIRNAANELQRTFIFSHDDYGNETSLTLLDATGKLLFREDYLITSADSLGGWKEIWGFVGTDANTCKVKSISFVNQ